MIFTNDFLRVKKSISKNKFLTRLVRLPIISKGRWWEQRDLKLIQKLISRFSDLSIFNPRIHILQSLVKWPLILSHKICRANRKETACIMDCSLRTGCEQQAGRSLFLCLFNKVVNWLEIWCDILYWIYCASWKLLDWGLLNFMVLIQLSFCQNILLHKWGWLKEGFVTMKVLDTFLILVNDFISLLSIKILKLWVEWMIFILEDDDMLNPVQ